MAPQLPSLRSITALSCHVLNNQFPEGRKSDYQETRNSWPIIPYLWPCRRRSWRPPWSARHLTGFSGFHWSSTRTLEEVEDWRITLRSHKGNSLWVHWLLHRQPARWLSSTRLKIGRLILPGQPAAKNRPITGRFHFLILWRLPFKIIKLKCPRQNSFTRGIYQTNEWN